MAQGARVVGVSGVPVLVVTLSGLDEGNSVGLSSGERLVVGADEPAVLGVGGVRAEGSADGPSVAGVDPSQAEGRVGCAASLWGMQCHRVRLDPDGAEAATGGGRKESGRRRLSRSGGGGEAAPWPTRRARRFGKAKQR